MWILTCTMRDGYMAVVADSGETPVWADRLEALKVGYGLGLPRVVPQQLPDGWHGIVDPTPYHPGMAFDAAREETKHWRTT